VLLHSDLVFFFPIQLQANRNRSTNQFAMKISTLFEFCLLAKLSAALLFPIFLFFFTIYSYSFHGLSLFFGYFFGRVAVRKLLGLLFSFVCPLFGPALNLTLPAYRIYIHIYGGSFPCLDFPTYSSIIDNFKWLCGNFFG